MLENITISGGGLSITKKNHSQPYDAISPSRKELSQQGKTILITGATAGIGFAIARAFAQAGPSTIIISSRRGLSVATAVSRLSLEFAGKGIQFLGFTCDVASGADVEALWRELEQGGLSVDVLVLNAGVGGADPYPLLKPGQIDRVWSDYETNVRGHLDFAQRFYNQTSRDKSKKLTLVNVSSSAIHGFKTAAMVPNYILTKSAGTQAIQIIAREVEPEDMQVISFHPGLVYTPMAAKMVEKDAFPWDSEDLPGHFAVWAASEEAKFLHGRFAWAAWDVDEMMSGEFRQKLDSDPSFLTVGVHGL